MNLIKWLAINAVAFVVGYLIGREQHKDDDGGNDHA